MVEKIVEEETKKMEEYIQMHFPDELGKDGRNETPVDVAIRTLDKFVVAPSCRKCKGYQGPIIPLPEPCASCQGQHPNKTNYS